MLSLGELRGHPTYCCQHELHTQPTTRVCSPILIPPVLPLPTMIPDVEILLLKPKEREKKTKKFKKIKKIPNVRLAMFALERIS
jgi:hypothetical protein